MLHIRIRWLVALAVAPLILFPVCYAIGLNTNPENITLQWAGILLGFAGEGAMGILSIRFGQEARRSWHDHKRGRGALWLASGIALFLAALWFAFFTWLLYPNNPTWRA